MPGIAGIVQFKKNDYLHRYVLTASEDLQYSPIEIVDKELVHNAAFCHVHHPHQSDNFALSDDRTRMLLFYGNIYDDEALRQRVNEHGDQKAGSYTKPELFLRSFSVLGREALCGLNGVYVMVIWDALKKELHIINDRYGFRNIYYWQSDKKFIFSTEVKVICRDPDFRKEIDLTGISNYLAFGHLMDDRTLFEKVKLLPRASMLSLSNNKDLIKTYWDYSFFSDDEPLQLEDYYVDGLFEVLKSALKKRVNGISALALPVSGGLDSRVIAALLRKTGFTGNVITYSYGHEDSLDVIYGRQIAKKLGYPHHFIQITDDYLKNHSVDFTRLSDGLIDCLNSHMLKSSAFIREMDLNSCLTGFMGDVQTGNIMLSKNTTGLEDDEEIVKILFRNSSEVMSEKDLGHYLKRDIYRNVMHSNFESFRKCYYATPSRNKLFRSRYVNLTQRQRRYTSFNIFCHEIAADTHAVFVDNDVIRFNLHSPPELLMDQNIYKKMIIKHLPEVAGISYNLNSRPLHESRLKAGLRWRWEKLNRNPLIKSTIGRGYARRNDNYLRSGEAIRRGSRDFIVSNIRNSSFLKEYLETDRINQMLDDHINERQYSPRKITTLLTLSLWHKLFVENSESSLTPDN
jgi:asparagine synthase (glutamine-hydrolysing)